MTPTTVPNPLDVRLTVFQQCVLDTIAAHAVDSGIAAETVPVKDLVPDARRTTIIEYDGTDAIFRDGRDGRQLPYFQECAIGILEGTIAVCLTGGDRVTADAVQVRDTHVTDLYKCMSGLPEIFGAVRMVLTNSNRGARLLA